VSLGILKHYHLSDISTSTRKLCYRKDDRAMRLIYGCRENFRDSLSLSDAHGYFSQNFSWVFVLIHPVNVRTKFKDLSFTRC